MRSAHLAGGETGSGPPSGREFSAAVWPGRSVLGARPGLTLYLTGDLFVSTEQRENLEAILRQSAFPAGISLASVEKEQEIGGFKERAERAEAWLQRISQEIEQAFQSRQPDAYAPRRSNAGR